jgi:hypothetical protein
MSTTTVTDWIGQAIAAYQAQQAAYAAEAQRRNMEKVGDLATALQALGIEAQPDTYPYTLDGVTFRLDWPEYAEQEVLQVRRVCAICGAESWCYVQSLTDLGQALTEPWTCYNYARHAKLQGQPADDPATALVEALRVFVNWERDNG